MPRIPIRPISKESHIADFRLATPPLRDQGVAKARPTQVVSEGKGILAQAVGDVGKALGQVAEYFAASEETTRISKSQHLQMDIADMFRDMKVSDSERTSDQAVGMLEEFKEKEEDLRILSISEDLDAKTTQELNHQFDKMYNRHAEWIVNWTIQQSDVADKEARIRVIQNAHKNVASLAVGDLMSIEREVADALELELERQPNLSEGQIETNRRAFREDFTFFAITKWIQDSPIAVVDFWDKNQPALKKALPKTYNQLNSKMNIARSDAKIDMAHALLMGLYRGDHAAMAEEVEKNPTKYFGEEGHQEDAFKLAANYRAIHNFEVSEDTRATQKREGEFFKSLEKKYRDPETNILYVRRYLEELQQAHRKGIISKDTYDSERHQVLRGEFSMELHHDLLRQINNDVITTTEEIFKQIRGWGVKPEPYLSALKTRQKDIADGKIRNYFKVVDLEYDRRTKRIRTELDVPQKELLLDPVKRGDFRLHLENRAAELGYSPGDSRILDIAKELFEGGWYDGFDIRGIEDIPEGEFHPGKVPWSVFGAEYIRRWEHEQLTGKQAPARRIESPAKETLDLTTPERKAAYDRLLLEGIYMPTERNMQDAIKIIAEEKE